MTDPNALMNAIYHETMNIEAHNRLDENGKKIGEITANNRGNTGAAIFDLKNYGNANTNIMDNGQWLSSYGNSDIIQNGNLSFVNDAINTNNGVGIGNAAVGLAIAGGGCATVAGCPVALPVGLTVEALEWIGIGAIVVGGTYFLNKAAKDLPATTENSNSASGGANKELAKNNEKKPEKETELKYGAANYHHQNSSGLKSKAPSNPESTLNDSVQVKNTSLRRIGVDSKTGEINVFDSTNNGAYHGHTRTWDELTQSMKNALIDAGKATTKGVILP
jgi:hypothetical protein